MTDDTLDLASTVVESASQHSGAEQQKKTPETLADEALLKEIKDNFALVSEVESEQRRQEDEDLYVEGETPWSQDHLDARAEHVDAETDQKVPARPALNINLIDQPVQRVINEARQARLAITVQPKAGLANTKVAGYYKGLIRAIQVDTGAAESRLWALERTAKCGRGAYEIDTEFANDGDFDIDIVYRPILDQSTIYWDPYAVMSDRRDADWCIKSAEWMTEVTRTRRWPRKPLIIPEGAFDSENDPWFYVDPVKGAQSVRVVVYYKVVYTPRTRVYHPALGQMFLDEMPPAYQEAVAKRVDPRIRTRKVDVRTVIKVFADGSQILEKHDWNGRYIPIIPTVGKQYIIKGQRKWKGIVTNCKDLNRGYVVTISAAVELAGSMPRAPYIMAEGQDAGYEEMWDDSPIKAYTRLYYKPLSLDGKTPLPPPQRQNREPEIQGMLLLARVLKDDIGSMTGSVDPALRAVNPYDRSGRAIEALNRQGAAGTSNFLDNLATISMPHEGRVLVDLIPHIYDRPGRIIGVMGEEDDDETAIMIKQPFVRDPDGNPIPVPCPPCGGTGQVPGERTIFNLRPRPATCPACQGMKLATKETMPEEFQGQRVEYVDLSEGQFKVQVSIGRNYQTKQEEAMAAMGELATAVPALVPLYADLWVRAMGFSGSQQIADRIKRSNPQAQDDAKMKNVPPEFMAKFEQLKLEHAAAIQQLQAASAALETDQVKTAGQKELLAMKLEAAEGLENLKQQFKVMEQTREQGGTAQLALLTDELEQMRQESEHRHEILLELIQEKRAKETERHQDALHEAAAQAAAEALPHA